MKRITYLLIIAIIASFSFVVLSYMTDSGIDRFINDNVEALAQDESCPGGIKNAASICVDGGIIFPSGSNSGEANIAGQSVKVQWGRKKENYIPWARYQCQQWDDNVCYQQGIYSRGVKLA